MCEILTLLHTVALESNSWGKVQSEVSYKHICSSWVLKIYHYSECSMNKWRNTARDFYDWTTALIVNYISWLACGKNLSPHFPGKWISHDGPDHWKKLCLEKPYISAKSANMSGIASSYLLLQNMSWWELHTWFTGVTDVYNIEARVKGKQLT